MRLDQHPLIHVRTAVACRAASGVSAYNGAGPMLESKKVPGTIVQVEGRARGVDPDDAGGADGAAGVYDPLSIRQVRDRVAPYVSS